MSEYKKVSRINEPVQPGDPIMSSHNYLWLKLRDWEAPAAKVRIHHPKNCLHGCAICEDCVDTWSLDYHLYFERTAGGRRILANAKALGKEIKLP